MEFDKDILIKFFHKQHKEGNIMQSAVGSIENWKDNYVADVTIKQHTKDDEFAEVSIKFGDGHGIFKNIKTWVHEDDIKAYTRQLKWNLVKTS
jgi:hypothetical protein